ncbi:hypothetical protein CYG48_12030 [Neorhizobium sp. SOG26]|jgi:Uncharacterized protein conserved in bacteria|uniref:ferritin-like domain-containing protein n=1 Tax=Neorhizobium sp. SOG26 TaxID=2060726 RepID=UPI000E57C8A6|nr:ferritin-like domain-containing protein [Neorhizobium sp. SOG26]AXV16365.1 hypothetical protein CYG48_12030 [Neorhizobium sp. SOG26]
MTHARDNFLAWLRAAHAMEEQAITMLTDQARRIESYPDLKERILRHLEETRGHEQAIKELIETFSASSGVLVLKEVAAKLAAKTRNVGSMLTNDEVVRGAVASYAFEHLEIGHYRMLIAAADELDEQAAKVILERILAEEIAMADWLAANLDATTRIFLMRDERDLMAKR